MDAVAEGSVKLDLNLVREVLIIKLDEIGDVVLSTAFLRELRKNLPISRITLVVSSKVKNLVELCPYVDEVKYFKTHMHGIGSIFINAVMGWRFYKSMLRSSSFDLVIAPRWDIDLYGASFLTYLTGATFRVGYSEKVNLYKNIFNLGYDRFYSHVINDRKSQHEVNRSLNIIKFLGGQVNDDALELWLLSEEEQFAENMLNLIKPDPIIAFGVEAGQPRKVWPIENFIDVGSRCIKEFGAHILVVGGCDAIAKAEQLKSQLGHRVTDVTGRTTLRQTAALLKRCALYVGNDSGPMHIAAAARVPVVEISCFAIDSDQTHRQSPYRFGPWKIKNIIVQPDAPVLPCIRGCIARRPHCILSVTVDDVLTSIKTMLSL